MQAADTQKMLLAPTTGQFMHRQAANLPDILAVYTFALLLDTGRLGDAGRPRS